MSGTSKRRGSRLFQLRWIAAAVAASLAYVGCVRTTLFDTDPERRDLNAKNLDRLLSGPHPDGPFTFVAMGDTHDEYDDTLDTIDIINATPDLSFVAHTGDITDRGLLQEFQWSQDNFDAFDIPILMSIGNHDAISDGKEIYRKMYGAYDYSFVYRNVKFVFFNSNTLEFPGTAPDRDWLLREVQDRQGAEGLVLVTHHGPEGPDDLDGGTNAVFYRNLLRNYDITLFIHGHLADWELTTYQGVPILQTGTFEKMRTYTLVSIDGGSVLSYEVCQFEECAPAQPTEPPLSAGEER